MGLITFMDVTWDDEDPEQCEKVRAMDLSYDFATVVDLTPAAEDDRSTETGD
jgi:hypothetical protein